MNIINAWNAKKAIIIVRNIDNVLNMAMNQNIIIANIPVINWNNVVNAKIIFI